MKHNNLISAMVLTMSMALVSCGDDDSKANQQANEVTSHVTSQAHSGIMDYIPADTPVLFVFSKDPQNPIPENLKVKMEKMYSGIGKIIKVAMQENFKKMAKVAPKASEMTDFMDKWTSEEGIKKLGLSLDENEFALYAVDLFPVLRMTLAKTHAMDEVLDELMNKANESKADTATKKDINGGTVYQFGDKEMQVMISLNGNSIVASLAPSREVEQLMSKLLGFEKPSKNIMQSNQYQDTIEKYNYLRNNIYWINIRQLADFFVNPDQHKTPMLDMLKIQDNILSADCKTEILEIFDKFPRLVGGYTLIDEHAMKSHMIIEMAGDLGSKLSTMTGRIPAPGGDAAISYGFSFDITAAKKLALEFVRNIEMQPYKCEFMTDLNAKAISFKAQLDQPLPPFVGNFKGVNVIVDELDLDMTKKNPNEMIKNLKAKVLFAVDNPEALQGMAEMMMPDLQKLGLKTGGNAVNVSHLIPVKGTQIPINLDHVFLAMGDETLGVSLGEGTDAGLTQSVSAGSTSDLFTVKITAELYKNIFSGLSDFSAKLPEEAQKQLSIQKMLMTDMLWWESEAASIDFTDRGFEVQMDIIY